MYLLNEEVQLQRLVILKLFILKLPNLDEILHTITKELNGKKCVGMATLPLSFLPAVLCTKLFYSNNSDNDYAKVDITKKVGIIKTEFLQFLRM